GMDNMKKYMDKDEAVNLMYASKYAQTANYWKNRQGMIDALTKFGTAKTKAKQEAKFNKWANKSENKAKYGNAVANINKYYSMTNEKARHDNYLQQLLRTSSYGVVSRSLSRPLQAYAKADAAKRKEMQPDMNEMIDEFFKEIHIPAEKDILAAQLKLYSTKSVGYPIAPMVDKISEDNNGDFTAYVNGIFELSLFSSPERMKAFLAAPSEDLLTADPLYKLSDEI